MTWRNRTDHADRLLWGRYREGLGHVPDAGEPDAGLIAAWLDGTLDDAERDRVEAWLAVSPRAMEVLIAAREVRRADPMSAPANLISAAKALLGRPAARRGAGGWHIGALVRGLEWSGAAAAIVIACIVGFTLGLRTVDDSASSRGIDLAAGEPAVLRMGAPMDGPFDPYQADPFAQGDAS